VVRFSIRKRLARIGSPEEAPDRVGVGIIMWSRAGQHGRRTRVRDSGFRWKVSSCGGSRYEQMIIGHHVKRAAAIAVGVAASSDWNYVSPTSIDCMEKKLRLKHARQ
jgi:hypothetical protein